MNKLCPEFQRIKDLPIKKLTYFLRENDDELEWYLQSLRNYTKEKNHDISKQNNTLEKQSKNSKNNSDLELQLTSQLVHDIKNPVAVINNASKILRAKKSDKDAIITQLDIIDRSTKQIANNIKKSLQHNKQHQIHKCDLDKIIQKSIKSLEIPNEIKIHHKKSGKVLSSNIYFLNGIFVNLILNAIEAIGKKGQITIIVSDEKDSVSISITNSGPSIPKSHMTKIFEPYFTTKENGTGFGLTNIKDMITQNGGNISVKNNPTTFTVSLPRDY